MDDDFRPIKPRQRLIIAVLTLATVAVIWTLLILQPGKDRKIEAMKAEVRAQRAASAAEHVGGTQTIILIAPGAPSASR